MRSDRYDPRPGGVNYYLPRRYDKYGIWQDEGGFGLFWRVVLAAGLLCAAAGVGLVAGYMAGAFLR